MLHNSKQTLATIGLILIGLLMGSLGTMWYLYFNDVTWSRPAFVETVQLGNASSTVNDGGRLGLGDEKDSVRSSSAETFKIESLNGVFRKVAAAVTPTVVFIEVEGTGGSAGFMNRFGRQGIVQSVGSGVIIGRDGFVVTNNHVIDGAQRIRVTLSDKREYDADLVGTDSDTDLAVLRLRSDEIFQSISFGESEDVQVGDWVLAVGNPFRLTSTVTAGIVSALGRQVDVINDRFGIESFIQTDAAINPGNSGGALVNLKGQLIGIATAIATETGSYAGYGFAVPVDLMDRVVKDLIQYGSVQRGFLGVSIQEIDSRRAAMLGLPDVRGVLLTEVHSGLAAANAGLRAGDVLLSIQGKKVSAPNELQSAVALHRPGEELQAELWRDGEVRSFTIRLSGKEDPQYESWANGIAPRRQRRPNLPDFSMPEGDTAIPTPELNIKRIDDLGAGFSPLPRRFKSTFGIEHGVYIAYVENGGLLYNAGIPGNAILLEAGEEEIDSIDALEKIVSMARAGRNPLLLKIRRTDGAVMFFDVTISE